MSHSYSAEEILEMLIGLTTQGRGGGAVDISKPPFSTVRKHRQSHQKPKRKVSARSKKYGRAFKRLAPRYKKNNGSWRKDGFKRCVRAAHAECRRKSR